MKPTDLKLPGALDPGMIDTLYQLYRKDPASVETGWQMFFAGFDFARAGTPSDGTVPEKVYKEFKVLDLIDAFRKRGHLFTQTNPVRARRKYTPTLDLENYGLTDADLDTVFHAGSEIGIGPATLRNIVGYLKETYCISVGAEYMFIRQPDKTKWLTTRIESTKNITHFSPAQKKQMHLHLLKAVGFESFIHRKFVGQKRFSLEGTEGLIPALHHIIDKGADLGIEEYVIGMAHRGRLNVLTNVMQKPYENVFQEFVSDCYEDDIALGDVKYHLGYNSTTDSLSGKKVQLSLIPNPSHLEAVSPVVEGVSRAKIDQKYQGNVKRLCPILIHGDAAIAGQGVVYEVVQMSELEGYRTGGTVHIVINNQVGFTTSYIEARSSTYCTDVGKVTKSPIFHINGDDVEAIVHTVRMAMEYRQQFHSDVFIDILSYRKYGHNEGDEPRFSQPTLYKFIENHPNPRDIYRDRLIAEGIYTHEEALKLENNFDVFLEDKLEESKKIKKTRIRQLFEEDWKHYHNSKPGEFEHPVNTKAGSKKIIEWADKINSLPHDLQFFRKTHKLVTDRRELISSGKADWAMAELLAYASLVDEGIPVRLSGQDSVRGTFAHRHAAHVIEDTDQKYCPLKSISPSQAPFYVYNSPLNEYGVLGFEYGYSLASPKALNIWEAQFGDFVNVAQVVIDQYISSAEEKWGLMSGITLLLPHGFEGQGPEHSSARIERFLSMAARQNMHIVVPTTPANIFHLLRLQVKRSFRVPLIIFTPKSLLRHPQCLSDLEEFSKGSFRPVIDDNDVIADEVRRVVLCSGKIYYELQERKTQLRANDIALVRVEQLHPFPDDELKKIFSRYPNALLYLWVQDEPENMGAWYHVRNHLALPNLLPVTRLSSGSPATGLLKIHNIQQEEIIQKVFRHCDCELLNKYCGLQCMVGKSHKEIMEQYMYFEREKSIK